MWKKLIRYSLDIHIYWFVDSFLILICANIFLEFALILLFVPWWAIFGVRIGFKNYFGVYSCSWKTFIFFVSYNSDIWFRLNFRVIFDFLGPNGLFLGLWKGSKTILGSTHVVEQLSFSMLPSIMTFDFDLILRSFLNFWGPNGVFLGLG